MIDTINNTTHKDSVNKITVITDEITALCPLTGLPDFGTLSLTYIPDKKLIELKSFKEYLHLFRNSKIWQEEFLTTILDEIVKSIDPLHISMTLGYKVRGGILTEVSFNYSRPEKPAIKPKSHCWTSNELLKNMSIGILTCGNRHSTPVNFIYRDTAWKKTIDIITDKNSMKVKIIKNNHKVSFLIHQEKGHFTDTSAIIIEGTAKVYDVVTSTLRKAFYNAIPYFEELDKYSESKHEDECIISIIPTKMIYFKGDGMLNEGGQ